MSAATAPEGRWQLYRLLGEPFRLRLLALASTEELSLGELAELLDESQPNVSRHAAPLRQAGLLSERRHGTRTFVRVTEETQSDPVVLDALRSGRALCEEEGRLARIPEMIQKRDLRTREFFAREATDAESLTLAAELPAYLRALSVLVPDRDLAVDVGTGHGALLDALAPIYRRVVALDRSPVQLARAERRVKSRGYQNVTLLCAELSDDAVTSALGAGADLVVAARMLHHAPRPRGAIEALSALLRPGGRLLVIDYQRHADDTFRERQADVWNGFEAEELESHARAAGLTQVRASPLPEGLVQNATDGHVGWQMLVGMRPQAPDAETARQQS